MLCHDCCILSAPIPTISTKGGGGLGGPHLVPQHSTQCPAHTVLNKYFLDTKRKVINGPQEPEKKTLGRWGAVLKDNSCLMFRPETPTVAFYRVGSAGPQAVLRLLSHTPPPPTCSASPGPATEGRKLTFIEGSTLGCTLRGRAH